jgi:predicted ATPase/transcriptional regulator with XRE-family HTH domain
VEPRLSEFSFGAWVQRRRKLLDLTQKELAARVGLSPVTLTKIERDERRPSRQVATLLADALLLPSAEHARFVRAARGEMGVFSLPEPSALPVESGKTVAVNAPVSQDAAASTTESQIAVPDRTHQKRSLPELLTPLVGRRPELDQIRFILKNPACRLLTLTGPGGVGKTRLALEAAHSLAETYPAGVVYVPLAPVTAAAYIPSAIGDVLDVKFSAGEPAGRELIAHLWGEQLLIVLDNLEHLVDSGAPEWLAELVASAPGVQLLATSRERLNLRGEWVFEVQGLPVPENIPVVDDELPSALALFIQSALRVAPGYQPSAEDWPWILHICQLVDGLPLGIELAATWVRMLTPQEICTEIKNSLDFLSTSVRDLPERHRSLRAVFDHSWQLMSAEEQMVLRRLSVFRGGFDRELAKTVAGASLAVLSSLLDKSMLRRGLPGRYDLHELIRQYASARLGVLGETAQIRRQHLMAYLTLGKQLNETLYASDPSRWREQMELEQHNFRGAFEWALHIGEIQAGLDLAMELWRYWMLRGMASEGRRWLEQLLARCTTAISPRVGRAHWRYAALARLQGDYPVAYTHLAIAQDAARQSGDTHALAAVLNELCLIAIDEERFDDAISLGLESLELMQTILDQHGEALLSFNLGRVELYEGRLETAQAYFEKSLVLAERISDFRVDAYASLGMGLVALNQHNFEQARQSLAKSLQISQRLGDQVMLVLNLESLGMLALRTGDLEKAVILYAAAGAVRRELNFQVPQANRHEYEQALEALREGLSPTRFESLWASAASLETKAILAVALEKAA